MEIEIPAIPAGILTLITFFSPYAVALVNHPKWSSGSKRLVSIAVSLALTLVVMLFYYIITQDVLPSWPVFILLALVVNQASFTVLWKSVKGVEGKHGVHK